MNGKNVFHKDITKPVLIYVHLLNANQMRFNKGWLIKTKCKTL